jgi:hypothetical protein
VRTCAFCNRWFKNKQAVRRHLGYCRDYLPHTSRGQDGARDRTFRCAACVSVLGAAAVPRITQDEMHAHSAATGGCPTCGNNLWADAGWRRRPETE